MAEQALPDFVFIDAILLAYRHGRLCFAEQKKALLAAAHAATDAITFMTALENFGVGRQSQLHAFVGEFLAAPAYYRALYPAMLGLRRENEPAESFLNNQRVLFLVEPVLSDAQQKHFFDAYWWFSHNHQPVYHDPKKGYQIGIYATDPQDNASTLPRFESYLLRLVNHSSQRIRDRFEGFPTEIVLAILKRAFL